MNHGHHLQHAVDGMVVHVRYDHVTEPCRIGSAAGNQPG